MSSHEGKRTLIKEEWVSKFGAEQRMVHVDGFAVRRGKTQETRWWEGIKKGGCPGYTEHTLCPRGDSARTISEPGPGQPLPQYSRLQMSPSKVSLFDWNIVMYI